MLKLELISGMQKVLPKANITSNFYGYSMLKNESFSFQAVIQNSGASQPYFVLSVNSRIPVEVYKVEYIPAAFSYKADHDGYILDEKAQLFPDLLKNYNGECFSAPVGLNTCFYITVSGDTRELPRGKHDITVILKDERGSFEEQKVFELTVIDELLEENDLIITKWIHYDCIADKTNTAPFSKEFYESVNKYIRAAASRGQTMVYIPMFTPPLDTEIGGERLTVQSVDVIKSDSGYSFGFDNFDKLIQICQNNGIKYFELSHLFTQWGAKACPKIIARTNGGEKQIFGWNTSSDSHEYLEFLSAFLPALSARLKALGIEKNCFLHLSDEPGQEHFQTYVKLSKFVKPLIPGIKTLDAISHYELYQKGGMDIPVVSLGHEREFAENRADYLVYYCCANYKDHYSNIFFNMPSLRTRILGVQLYLTNVKGFLQWGYNFYNSAYSKYKIDPYKVADSGGFFPAGDAFAVYPAPDGGVYSSLRQEAFNFGIQDYRALKRLEKKIGRQKTVELVKSFGFEENFYEYNTIDRNFENFRAKVNKLIAE